MQLNQIFGIEKYNEASDFANANDYTIIEVEPIEEVHSVDGSTEIKTIRQFKIIEKPKLNQDEILELLRLRRENECFPIINRGILWYNLLTDEQRLELDKWYKEWLDITDTYKNAYEQNPEIDIETIIPIRPTWLK